jgi:hypothetical protein
MKSGNTKWTLLETKNLISEFEEPPCLCNVIDKGYRNKDMKAAPPRKIALSLGFSVGEIKKGRSCINSAFCMKLLIEKRREFNLGTHIVFVDYEKAFDKEKRQKLFNILKENNIPNLLLKNILEKRQEVLARNNMPTFPT